MRKMAVVGIVVFLVVMVGAMQSLEQPLEDKDAAEITARVFLGGEQGSGLDRLRGEVEDVFRGAQGEYSFYLEELDSGARIGVNEEERYVGASLFKVITMVGVLKAVERGELALDTRIPLLPEDISAEFGDQVFTEGDAPTVESLLERMMAASDNTAARALARVVLPHRLLEAWVAVGLPLTETLSLQYVSAKEFGRVFRSLHFSTYLEEPLSRLGLSYMLKTDFNEGIVKSIPKNVQVPHKIGVWEEGGSYHDCGIVYHPRRPYVLCVLSRNTTQDQANQVFSQVSKRAYEAMGRV